MHVAYRRIEEGGDGQRTAELLPFSSPRGTSPQLEPYAPAPREAERRANWLALGAVGGAHALLIVLLLSWQVVIDAGPRREPMVVRLLSEPPPPPEIAPPPPQPSPVKPAEHPVVAPEPIIKTSAPPPAAIQAADTPPPRPAAIDPSPAPAAEAPAPPAPAPAPAPVVPPDFRAAYLDNPAPRYPLESRRRKEQGTVMVKVLVSPAGKVQELKLSKSSGFERLDKVALDAVRKWRFVPAKQGGRPVEAWVIVPIPFILT